MPSHDDTILALDVGERRIGVAIAGLQAWLPRPWGVIERSEETALELKRLITEEHAQAIIVGLPRGLDSQETSQTIHTRAFIKDLKADLDIPVFFQDEALTSKEAEAELKTRGVRYNKGDVDALSAVYILNEFLKEHSEV